MVPNSNRSNGPAQTGEQIDPKTKCEQCATVPQGLCSRHSDPVSDRTAQAVNRLSQRQGANRARQCLRPAQQMQQSFSDFKDTGERIDLKTKRKCSPPCPTVLQGLCCSNPARIVTTPANGVTHRPSATVHNGAQWLPRACAAAEPAIQLKLWRHLRRDGSKGDHVRKVILGGKFEANILEVHFDYNMKQHVTSGWVQ
jgi:hypothetical protein